MLSQRCCGVSILLLLLAISSHHAVHSASDFSWSDCGVQLTKDIHYQSVEISPSSIGTSGPLSINVEGSVINDIYNADMRLVVTKDGEEFLDVYIDDLCTIISTTNSLRCPLRVGSFSFTYTFATLPPLIAGDYNFQIRSEINGQEDGCLSLSGTAGGLAAPSGTSTYTSSFVVTISGNPQFDVADYTQRQIGQSISIGTTGNYGKFSSLLEASADLGGNIDTSSFVWDAYGILTAINSSTSGQTIHYYSGTYEVLYTPNTTTTELFLNGSFSWAQVFDSSSSWTLSGTLDLDPVYVYYSSIYSYPVVLGNLLPFSIKMGSSGGATFVVSGTHSWCTVGVDACGTCGGDGSTCGQTVLGGSSSKSADATSGWTKQEYAAVIIGVVGGVLCSIAIVILVIMIIRAKRIPTYDDSDLIDHPQKPDYGTMAIDDIMREGERAPF